MKYFALTKNGLFVNIDTGSGGYPSLGDIREAYIWTNIIELVKYNNSFAKDDFNIVEVVYHFKPRIDIENAAKAMQNGEIALKELNEAIKKLN